jgi:uncharacterized phage protein gp47/JayE
MFQIKDFPSITASAINWVRATTKKVTDFNIGSVVRTMIEACAAEIEELYQQMFIGLREAIPVSVYNSFDFAALDASPTSGLVRVTVTPGATSVSVSAGSKFTIDGRPIFYTATTDVVIDAGNTFADVPVVASANGADGNIAAGQVFSLQPAPSTFLSATNLADLINGRDTETDEQRKLRFREFIAALNRGTARAIEYGVREFCNLNDSAGHLIERAQFVSVIEPWLTDKTRPVGLVEVYIHNGSGATSAALVSRARDVVYGYVEPTTQNKVPGWKAAGIQANVYACTEQYVNMYGVVTELSGFDHTTVADAVTAAVQQYILELDIGAPALVAEIIAAAMAVDGIYNFTLTLPAADVQPADSVKLMPGYVAMRNPVIAPFTGTLAVSGNLPTRTP